MRIVAKRVGKHKAPEWDVHMRRAFHRAFSTKIKPRVIKHFESIVERWKHKPEFRARLQTKGEIILYVAPTGKNAEIWHYVSRGTRPHVIRPRNKKALSFMWAGPGSYMPKTLPAKSVSLPGVRKKGTRVAFAKVNHPGTDAREFEERFMANYKYTFSQTIRATIAEGKHAAWRGV